MVSALHRHLANKAYCRRKELAGIRRFNQPDFVPIPMNLANSHVLVDNSSLTIPFDTPDVVIGNLLDDEDILTNGNTHTPMEEVVEEMFEPASRGQFKQPFPPDMRAGEIRGIAKMAFEHVRDKEILKEGQVLEPFRDEDEWELAKWLIKNIGHSQTEAFLQLPIVSVVRLHG